LIDTTVLDVALEGMGFRVVVTRVDIAQDHTPPLNVPTPTKPYVLGLVAT
jgi:hypothetical protein